jgi:hypothetical protein
MRFITLSLMVSAFLFGTDPTASSRGSNIGNTAMSLFGSKEGVNNKLSQPLMSNTQMTTVDGSKSFDTQMQCPSSSKSVGITFLPSTGNDYRLLIKQDTDLNGAFDYTYDTSTLGRTVSGVCTNGVLMCNPSGSWTDCKPYVWSAVDNKISLRSVVTNSSELGACYCSNASCNVTTLAPQIYENIGGGISAAVMHSNPLFLLSKSEWNFAEMTYYLFGQNKTNCSGIGTSNWDQYGETNPTQYYNNQTPPNTSIAEVAINQGNDPNSYYSMLSHQNEVSYNGTGDTIGMPSRAACTLTKSIHSTVSTEYDCTATVSWNGQQWCELAHAGYGARHSGSMSASITNLSVSLKNAQSVYVVANYDSSSCDDDRNTITVKYSGDAAGEHSYVCPSSKKGIALELINNTSTVNKNVLIEYFNQTHSLGGWDYYNTHVYKTSTHQKETFSITESSNCPSDCTLIEEQTCDANGLNCIYTVRNGVNQNITLQRNCKAYSSSITSGSLCADGNTITMQTNEGLSTLFSGANAWFYIKRTYDCGSHEISIDSSKMTRAAGTATKADSTATSMTYTDQNGAIKTINSLPTGDNCPTPACTIKRPKVDTAEFSDRTNRSQTTGGTTVYETVIKTCTKSGTTAICSLDTGETMLEDCSCTGSMVGFQQAISTLGAVSEASKDMICSQ